jgi:rhodanese-related sulfurtransferase
MFSPEEAVVFNAASVLAASGVEGRPVRHGGVFTWQARGGPTVEVRRCGN